MIDAIKISGSPRIRILPPSQSIAGSRSHFAGIKGSSNLPPLPGGLGGGGDPYDQIMVKWNKLKRALIREGASTNDIDHIYSGFTFAFQAHINQTRETGEPYVIHCLEVAIILVDLLKVTDRDTIIAALLHDVAEDTQIDIKEIDRVFKGDVAKLVDILTKMPRTHFKSHTIRVEENRRKLNYGMTEDFRVALIKLGDRLHNSRTLAGIKNIKNRRRIALETLQYFVPLADLLGIWLIKRPLEDLSFSHLYPDDYQRTKEFLDASASKRAKMSEDFRDRISELLHVVFDISYPKYAVKPRTVYSIFKEMREFKDLIGLSGKRKRLMGEFSKVRPLLDLDTFNIILLDENDCERAFQAITAVYTLVEGTLKDSLTVPKANFYSSKNFEVETGEFGRVRIKIRTPKREAVNDRGIAAHYYELDKDLPAHWTQFVEYIKKGISDSTHVSEDLKKYSFPIMVSTPKGKRIVLPKRSTYLDFAFEVHSGLGLAAGFVIVNGKRRKLSEKIEDGDVIEVVKSRSKFPRRSVWVKNISPSNGEALRRVRRHLEAQPDAENIKYGRRVLNVLFKARFNMTFFQIKPEAIVKLLKRLNMKCGFTGEKEMKAREDLFRLIGTLWLKPELVPEEFDRLIERRNKKKSKNRS
jgi:GTP pyrophosphokinase